MSMRPETERRILMQNIRHWIATSVLLLITVCAASAAFAGATAYVVHGIPGEDLGLDPNLPVDVSINGDCALEGITFGEIVGPLAFEEDTYDFAIALANADFPCSEDPVIEAPGVLLEDGINYSIVAHLKEDGDTTASVLINDLSTSRRKTRANVYHLAAAPAVDVKFKSTRYWWYRRLIRDLANGEGESKKLKAGHYNVKIFPAGSRRPVSDPVSVVFKRNTAYAVYAVGSLKNKTFTLLLTDLESAEPRNASVFVVHGIPGDDLGLDPDLPVDVSINGDCALEEFMFGEIIGPIELPEGSYDIAIGLANADEPCSEEPVINADDVKLYGNLSYSIVAHLSEKIEPTASVFLNNLSAYRYFPRVNVFHTAAAPRVDIRFERSHLLSWRRTLKDVGNGEGDDLLLFRGAWDVSILPAGGNTPVFGPTRLKFKSNKAYLAYAVGSLTNKTFTVLLTSTSAVH